MAYSIDSSANCTNAWFTKLNVLLLWQFDGSQVQPVFVSLKRPVYNSRLAGQFSLGNFSVYMRSECQQDGVRLLTGPID